MTKMYFSVAYLPEDEDLDPPPKLEVGVHGLITLQRASDLTDLLCQIDLQLAWASIAIDGTSPAGLSRFRSSFGLTRWQFITILF